MANFRKSSYTSHEMYADRHRFEHWYRDNTVYFITARCRDRFAAFAEEEAKQIFWDRFGHYCVEFEFVPWATTLMNNHYHTIGYMRRGENLGPMMQRIHGSVAKLVNDTLPNRHLPFWRRAGNQDYFDGCIRDVLQAVRAYWYTVEQAVRHGIVPDCRKYRHTHIGMDIEPAIARAVELNAFLEDVPYARYEGRGRFSDHGRRHRRRKHHGR